MHVNMYVCISDESMNASILHNTTCLGWISQAYKMCKYQTTFYINMYNYVYIVLCASTWGKHAQWWLFSYACNAWK